MIASHSRAADLSSAHPWCESLVPPHPKGALLDWDLVTVEVIWVKWTHCHVQETSLRWFDLCDMVHYPAGSTSEDGTLVDGQKQYSGRLWFKRWWYSKCAKKIPPHHYTTITSLNRWDAQDDPCFHVLYTKFWPYIWMQQKLRLIRSGNVFPIFYCPVLVSLCELYPPCAVLIWQERHRCGLLLLEPICFRVRRVVCSEMVFCRSWL